MTAVRSLVCEVAQDNQEHEMCAWHTGRGWGCVCPCHENDTERMNVPPFKGSVENLNDVPADSSSIVSASESAGNE